VYGPVWGWRPSSPGEGGHRVDLGPLMNSAEGYLQVWERAEARGPSVP